MCSTFLGAFCALRSDGKVVPFGLGYVGGSLNLQYVTAPIIAAVSSGVKSVFANKNAFAALRNDLTVYCWGRADAGEIFL